MKSRFITSALLLICATPAIAAGGNNDVNNCQEIKSTIAQRIIDNGVPADGFSLTLVASDQLDQAEGKEVGHCGHGKFKIFYTKHAAKQYSK